MIKSPASKMIPVSSRLIIGRNASRIFEMSFGFSIVTPFLISIPLKIPIMDAKKDCSLLGLFLFSLKPRNSLKLRSKSLKYQSFSRFSGWSFGIFGASGCTFGVSGFSFGVLIHIFCKIIFLYFIIIFSICQNFCENLLKMIFQKNPKKQKPPR